MIVKDRQTLRAFDAVCPHRGAHLAGGSLEEGNCIVCPFHGCRIGLDSPGAEGFMARERPLWVIGGLLFIDLSKGYDNGFRDFFTAIDATHYIIPGFGMKVRVRPEMVIENAFDQMHFRTVHSILNEPRFAVCPSKAGEYRVESVFDIPPSAWQRGREIKLSVPYRACAFNPHLVVSELGGAYPYYVITSAVAINKEECMIRLSIAVKPTEDQAPPSMDLYKYLLDQSKKGLELDKRIWEEMDPDAIQRFTREEKAVVGFQQFCKRFV